MVNCQKMTQRVMCFLMHGFRTRTKITADYGEKLVVLGEAFSEGTTGLVVPLCNN
jgi:hypothetical protein